MKKIMNIAGPVFSLSCLMLTGYLLYKQNGRNMLDIIIEEIDTIK